MAEGDVHVKRAKGGWRVEVEGAHRTGSTHRTQKEALAVARERARQTEVELVLHDRHGRIRDRNRYGARRGT
jgi:hypothetical protein